MNTHRSLVRVGAQLLNRPLLVTERHGSLILSALRRQLNLALIHETDGTSLDHVQMDAVAASGRNRANDRKSRREINTRTFDEQNGIAIIPVTGTLMKNWGLDPYSGSTGYDGIKQKLVDAMDDGDVNGIYLDIDSPGGMVAGCFDLCDLIWSMSRKNGGKPIWAIANEQACSAAYAIMSSADRGIVTRTAEVGSIGVLWLYTNVEGMMKQEGVEVRVFRAGKYKLEVNPYEQISKDAAERIQTELEEIREIFVETVARGMSLSKKAVRDTEALTYMGAHARDIKLATDVMSDDQAWTMMVQRYGR